MVTNTIDYMKKWRENNRERYNLLQRNWRKNNRVKHRMASKRWQQNNRDKVNLRAKRYYYKYPERARARRIANYYLGQFRPPGFEFHHPDYSKPLMVELLPIKFHQKMTKEIRYGY